MMCRLATDRLGGGGRSIAVCGQEEGLLSLCLCCQIMHFNLSHPEFYSDCISSGADFRFVL
jgi:hypothetical protein